MGNFSRIPFCSCSKYLTIRWWLSPIGTYSLISDRRGRPELCRDRTQISYCVPWDAGQEGLQGDRTPCWFSAPACLCMSTTAAARSACHHTRPIRPKGVALCPPPPHIKFFFFLTFVFFFCFNIYEKIVVVSFDWTSKKLSDDNLSHSLIHSSPAGDGECRLRRCCHEPQSVTAISRSFVCFTNVSLLY